MGEYEEMTSNKKRYYFAYGSNLNIEQMLARCPGAEIVGWAELKGHELLFKGSRRGSFLTVEPGEGSVWIGVWSITAEDEHALDRYEGVPKFYEKREIALDVHLVPTPRPHPTTYRAHCTVRDVSALTSASALAIYGEESTETLKGLIYVMTAGRRPYIPSRRFETYAEGFEAFGFPLADLSDAWAPGLPLSAAGFESYRYKKD